MPTDNATDTKPSLWEVVHDVPLERVRRMPVGGGWLYQVEIDQVHAVMREGEPATCVTGWHPPVFVAHVSWQPPHRAGR